MRYALRVLTKSTFAVLFLMSISPVACAVAERQADLDASRGKDAPRSIDAPQASIDAPVVAVDGPMPSAATKLILTEVVLTPSGSEFVEIANPTSQAVALDNYYLTDSQKYPTLPSAVPTVDSTDVIARFPAGASIAPHAVITVAFDTTANFQTAYGMAPTYSIGSSTMRIVAQTGSTGLTNAGEMVSMFWWDGATDLVKDCDELNVGVPSGGNLLPNKTGVAVDGPDSGSTKSTYATDSMTMVNLTATPGNNLSMKRIKFDTGFQTAAATGNGITGDDETSEMLSQTWATTFTAPTPGAVPFTL
jgi:hypothetical protein